jgi:hypothetical protein
MGRLSKPRALRAPHIFIRIKNTLKMFPLSHVVCYVSVVSVTNKGAQEHLRVSDRVPDSVSDLLPFCHRVFVHRFRTSHIAKREARSLN